MSCDYAEGLSRYENKGVLGVPEKFDGTDEVEEKCALLAKWIQEANHVVVHTGAGISCAAGIPDFRGPKGVWTLERNGEKPAMDVSFNDAVPTKTHMALCALVEQGYVHYIVSQNIDGLHLKSGLERKHIAELHGNIFVEQCNKCRRQFVRTTASPTVGQKPCGGVCRVGSVANGERACRGGILLDNVLDWEHDLPEKDLDMAFMHSTLADLNITLGTTLQIIPSGNLPLRNKKHNGRLVICNLQPTKHDKKADLIVSTYVDDILTKVCKRLGVEVPEYNVATDPTREPETACGEWTLQAHIVKSIEQPYNAKLKKAAEQRKRGKNNYNNIMLKNKKSKVKDEIEMQVKQEKH